MQLASMHHCFFPLSVRAQVFCVLCARLAFCKYGCQLDRSAMGKKQKPRPADASTESPSAKKKRCSIPDVADMGGLMAGGRAEPKPVLDDKVHVGLYEYAKLASVYSDVYGTGKLWVALMLTARKPSPLYKNKRAIELYGEAASKDEDPPPPDSETLAMRYHALNQFVWHKTVDTDGIGWKKGSMGWYIEEEYIKDFFMYFDDLMAWRKDYYDDEFEKIEGDNISIVIHMLPTATFNLAFDRERDELKCGFEVVKEAEQMMSLFDLPPPHFPARIIVLTFQVLEPKKVHAIFSGNTKPFQANFVQRGIKGKSIKMDPADLYGEYYRVKEYLSLEDEVACVAVLRDLFENCLLSSPVVVRLKDTKHDTEQLQKVIANFKDVSNIRIEL